MAIGLLRGLAPNETSAADRSRKSIFTRIAQAGDNGPQASPELSPCVLDAPTLLLKVRATLFEQPANLSELSKRSLRQARSQKSECVSGKAGGRRGLGPILLVTGTRKIYCDGRI